jgi:hypothetical protein
LCIRRLRNRCRSRVSPSPAMTLVPAYTGDGVDELVLVPLVFEKRATVDVVDVTAVLKTK